MVKKNKWFIAFKKREADIFNLDNLTIIEPEPDTYEADPFLLEKDGKTYLFFELYNYDKGVIAYREIFPDGTYSKPKVVLSLPYHLSFPALFEENGEVFMTPETINNGRLEIWKAKKFPDEWELYHVVSSGLYDDPMLYKTPDWYYIITTEGENNLRIFRGKTLSGGYDLVVSESREQARNAGHIFSLNGKTIRPCQDNTERYGGGILFYETNFPQRVQTIHKITPDWFPGANGTHTFNLTENWQVIDARIPLNETNLDTP